MNELPENKWSEDEDCSKIDETQIRHNRNETEKKKKNCYQILMQQIIKKSVITLYWGLGCMMMKELKMCLYQKLMTILIRLSTWSNQL